MPRTALGITRKTGSSMTDRQTAFDSESLMTSIDIRTKYEGSFGRRLSAIQCPGDHAPGRDRIAAWYCATCDVAGVSHHHGGRGNHGGSVFDGDATSDNEGRSSELQSRFKAKTSWYLDAEELKPGSTRWKGERDIVSLYTSCDDDFGRDIRTEFLSDPTLIPGSERLRKAGAAHPSALAIAEECAFMASVVQAIAKGFSGPLAFDLNIRDPPEEINYEAASAADKKRLIQGVQLRISLLSSLVAQSPLRARHFRLDVVQNSLHLIAFNDQLPPPEWLKETFLETCSVPASEPVPVPG